MLSKIGKVYDFIYLKVQNRNKSVGRKQVVASGRYWSQQHWAWETLGLQSDESGSTA